MCGEQDSFTEDYEVYKSEETLQSPHRAAAAAAAGISQVLLICMDGGTFQAAAGGRIYSGDMLLHSAGLGTIKT